MNECNEIDVHTCVFINGSFFKKRRELTQLITNNKVTLVAWNGMDHNKYCFQC